jgi:lysophospholipase L1-like esterase
MKRGVLLAGLFLTLAAHGQNSTATASATAGKPTLYVVGDSTANSGAPIQGWGTPFIGYFDPAKITVLNKARGGRSSRSYIHEGLWDGIGKQLKPGDIVLLQFGHNDAGKPSAARAGDRPSLPGLGEETGDFPNPAGQTETVHTFGHYMREYIADAQAKQATIILITLTDKNDWKEGKADRGGSYSEWTREIAQAQHVPLVDLSNLVADQYDVMGPAKVAVFYGTKDTTHSTPAGAAFNAEQVVAGLKALPGNPVGPYLSDKGLAVTAANAKYVAGNAPPGPATAAPPAAK